MDGPSSDTTFPWPPQNRQCHNQMTFPRTSYDLDLADPSSADTVIVKVGPESAPSTFCLPGSLLESSSDFFRNALKQEWFDFDTRMVSLSDVEPKVFDLYARWLAAGAEILTEEDDWKATYTEYIKWQLTLDAERESGGFFDKDERISPFTVWDFKLTTRAWWLGDRIFAPKFQNHCVGCLYYMNLRFDHILFDETYEEDWREDEEGQWHQGTVAYVDIDDVLLTWEESEAYDPNLHPLRCFYRDWLEQYLVTYEPSWWDYGPLEGMDELVERYPRFAVDLMCAMMSDKANRRRHPMKALRAYWTNYTEYEQSTEPEERPQGLYDCGWHWRQSISFEWYDETYVD